MIDERDLMELSGNFKDVRQLERDYLLTLLLHEIYSVFSDDLIFKGGTALKYFFNLNRFSEDLDFTFEGEKGTSGRKYLNDKIDSVLNHVSVQYEIVGRERRGNKVGNDIVGVNHEIRVRGPLNQRQGQLQNIKIDISLRNDIIRKPDLRYISPVYPDITTFSLPVMNVEEILAEKIAAMIERDKMRDIYDIYYLLAMKNLKYDEKSVEEKMLRRGEVFKKTDLRRKLLEARSKMKWRSELAYIVNPVPDNLVVIKKLEETFGLA
ncbi:MAG: nucleotidyl transferase AbiEii/AbiGii toxin family protein [Thermoplasmataceae archaeon]